MFYKPGEHEAARSDARGGRGHGFQAHEGPSVGWCGDEWCGCKVGAVVVAVVVVVVVAVVMVVMW